MSYLKLQVADSLKLPWLRASMQVRGTLVTLLMYCCAQENDGVIEDCLSYGDQDWNDLARVSLQDVRDLLSSGLAWWNKDGGLVLDMYDSKGQRALEVKRAQGEHGTKGGRPAKKPHGKPIRETHMANPHTTPHQCGEDSPKGSSSPSTLGFTAPVLEKQEKPKMDLRALMAAKEARA